MIRIIIDVLTDLGTIQEDLIGFEPADSILQTSSSFAFSIFNPDDWLIDIKTKMQKSFEIIASKMNKETQKVDELKETISGFIQVLDSKNGLSESSSESVLLSCHSDSVWN